LGKEKKRKEKRKKCIMNIFYHFRLPVEAVLSNGAKNCFSFSNESALQVKSRPELF